MLPAGFIEINTLSILGIPIPAVYVLVLAVVLWIVSERLPLGRHIYAIGANEKAAALNGIPVRAYVIGVFVASGLIAGFAGCVLAAKLRIGQANVGLDYLLPALVGAFLGSTTIKPGRVNVWGTIVGVLILAVGISGIQQLGGAFFVEPLFNGTTLVISIALAGFAQRRRAVVRPARDRERIRARKDRRRAGRMFRTVARYRRPSSAVAEAPDSRPDEPEWLASISQGGIENVETSFDRRGACWPPPPSSACTSRRPGGRRRLHEDGQGLYRQGVGAGDDVDRPDHRPEGAGQEADRLRLGRPAERRRAAASATAPRKRPRRSAGTSASSTGRARCRRARRRSPRRSR